MNTGSPSPDPPNLEAARQLAAWLKFAGGSGPIGRAAALEGALLIPRRGTQSFLNRIAKGRRIESATEDELTRFIAADAWFRRLIEIHGARAIRRWNHPVEERTMSPRWPGLPEIATLSDFATWLGGFRLGEIEWLAGMAEGERRIREIPETGRNYFHRWIPRRRGAPPRLLACPKPLLKSIQRKILNDLLVQVPVSEAAHGFRKGRSIVTFSEPHVGAECVVRMDLADFFPSIRFGRVASLFALMGYPESVARMLAGLCCHRPPLAFLRSAPIPPETRAQLSRPHVPQGAPTSPALSNIAAFRLDRRLAGLASAAGARYTRYADDLAFSGTRALKRGADRLVQLVARIALEEGFELNYRKTRVMPSCSRQQIAGVVVNARTNAPREVYDQLKATLHRWETKGLQACLAETENATDFVDRLRGGIAALGQLNPEKGAKLRQRFDSLWEAS